MTTHTQNKTNKTKNPFGGFFTVQPNNPVGQPHPFIIYTYYIRNMKSRKFLRKLLKMAKQSRKFRPQKRRTKKLRGGQIVRGGEDTPPPQPPPPTLGTEAKNNTYTNTFVSKAANSTAAATDLLANVATATAVGQATVVALSGTGVGLPVAGILAVALLLVNKLATLMADNLMFIGVLYDTTNIITNYYLLYDFIEIRNFILQLTLFYKRNPQNPNTNTFLTKFISTTPTTNQELRKELEPQINNMYAYLKSNNTTPTQNYIILNEDIKSRIVEKLSVITKSLLELSPNNIIQILLQDQTLHAGLKTLITEEAKKRGLNPDGSKSSYMIFRKLGKLSRGIKRATSSKYYQDIIIKDLTIMGNYFMLLKSQQDEGLMYYRQELKTAEGQELKTAEGQELKTAEGSVLNYNNVWKYIENTKEYRDYLFAPSVQTILASAPITASSTSVLKEGIEKEEKKEDATAAAQENAPAAV